MIRAIQSQCFASRWIACAVATGSSDGAWPGQAIHATASRGTNKWRGFEGAGQVRGRGSVQKEMLRRMPEFMEPE